MNSFESPRCGQCGGVLPPNLPRGMCPRCAITAANDSDIPAGEGSLPHGGRHFGDYELIRQLGRGGMGVVYQARQKSLNRHVAVKMLLNAALSSPAAVQRFEMEAETVARLDHPHIVPIYEVGTLDGQHYFSMKLIKGESLAQQIGCKKFTDSNAAEANRRGRFQERSAQLMLAIARAVDYAHRHGVLHRDLKPGNILIDDMGEPHLTDFGLAKAEANVSLTASSSILGTPAYMAPEQIDGGSASAASDTYSLGVILYELLAGDVPFRGTTLVETLRRVADEEAPHPKTINRRTDHDLGLICMKAIEKNPIQRYASAAEFAADLERWLRREPVRARPARVWTRTARWMARNKVGTALITVLCLGLSACVLLLLLVKKGKDARQAAVNTLVKSIGARVDAFPQSKRPFEHFSAEEIRIILGQDPPRGPPSARQVVATFIDLTAMQTLITFGKLVTEIEAALPANRAGTVRLDLRIYKDYAALRNDLAAGAIHFASVDGQLCLQAQAINPAVQALVCDRRPGLQTVIFTRADTGISNLFALNGHSLSIPNSPLVLTAFVFPLLVEAGLCSTNLECRMLPPEVDEAETVLSRKSKSGFYGGRGPIVSKVLLTRESEAGVAFERQLDPLKEGVEWRRLGTFRSPDFIWVAGAGADAAVRTSFVQTLLQFNNPRDLECALADVDSDGFAYTTSTENYFEAIRAAGRAQARFEQCSPQQRK